MAHLRNGEFGRYTTLKEITIDDITSNSSSSNNNNKESKVHKPTRIIRISEYTYRRLISHSQKFYDVVSYNEIIENLLKDFESHNKDKTWRDLK